MREHPSAATPSASGAPGSGARSSKPTKPVNLVVVVIFSVVVLAALIAVDALTLSRNNPIEALSPHYYMALGNSLSFGYQPNLDFSSGFADDILNDMRQAELKTKGQQISIEGINYACAGETTTTMITGGCVGEFAHHGSYTGAQLQAALAFLKDARHLGRVSPITLEVGANDVDGDFDPSTCTVSSSADADLARMDANLTGVILPELVKALTTPTGALVGDLHMLNYYNPYAKICPNSAVFAHELNDHLQADAAKFRIPVVDIYAAFGGDSGMASRICTLTWVCDPRFQENIHPTTEGYRVIADAVEAALGLPGAGPMLGGPPLTRAAPAPGARFEARFAARFEARVMARWRGNL